MQMLARLRYLFAEGFEVSSLSGYDDDSGEGNAKIVFLERDPEEPDASPRLRSELFNVDKDEMEQCSRLFLSHRSRNR
jgi:hypothetical protein